MSSAPVALLLGLAVMGGAAVAMPAMSPPPILYAFNKQNPRWETEGHGPTHQFHKPYKPLRVPPEELPPRERGGRHASSILSQHALLSVTGIVALVIGAQWLSWYLSIPTTLPLLVCGFAAGPASGLLDPDVLFGNLLLPLVSLSLAVVLFQRSARVQLVWRRDFRRFLTPSLLVAWVLSAVAADMLLGFDPSLAILAGALLLLTCSPAILESERSDIGRGASLLDVVATVLVVLVFEAILAGGAREAAGPAVAALLKTVAIAIGVGVVGAAAFVTLRRRRWIPDQLEVSIAWLLVIAMFALANVLREGSGFVAVIVMGVVLASRRRIDIRRVTDTGVQAFATLAGIVLFVLAARLRAHDVAAIGGAGCIFVGVVVLVVRPLAVFVSTWRRASWRERLSLSVAPTRGLEPAALASVIGLRLGEVHEPHAEVLVSLTILVIAATVTLAALADSPIARRLAVASRRESAAPV